MDPDEIARRVNNLKLSSHDSDGPVIIPADQASFGKQRLESCLVGKVFSSKAVNREAFRSQMPRILQVKKPVDIEAIGQNLFLLDFSSSNDRQRTLLDGPWTFFKDMVIFKAPTGLQQPTEMIFDNIPIWVQCHNVPLAFMHSTILRTIGSKIGRVIEIDAGEDGNCVGKYARLRIALDITKPLRQGIWVQPEKSTEEICIILLYERIPNFCFLCGRVGHVLRDCDDKGEASSEAQFGNWLRASPLVGDRKTHSTKSNGPNCSDSPSGQYRDATDDIVEPFLLALPPNNRSETDNTQEKSDSADNLIHTLESQIPIHSAPNMNPIDPMSGNCSKGANNLSPNPLTGHRSSKRKWKSLARGSAKCVSISPHNSASLASTKRSSTTQDSLLENPKKARHSNAIDSEVILVSAAAALQPRQSL